MCCVAHVYACRRSWVPCNTTREHSSLLGVCTSVVVGPETYILYIYIYVYVLRPPTPTTVLRMQTPRREECSLVSYCMVHVMAVVYLYCIAYCIYLVSVFYLVFYLCMSVLYLYCISCVSVYVGIVSIVYLSCIYLVSMCVDGVSIYILCGCCMCICE